MLATIKKIPGFTLAELLVAIVIMAVVGGLTIPKLLRSQTESQYKPMGKDVAAMIASAYNEYSEENAVGANTEISHLTPYFNYVKINTTGSINYPNGTAAGCGSSPNHYCMIFHNGGAMRYQSILKFNSTAATNAIYFYFDPDGKLGGANSVMLWVYLNGKVNSGSYIATNSCNNNACNDPGDYPDPTWFSWN